MSMYPYPGPFPPNQWGPTFTNSYLPPSPPLVIQNNPPRSGHLLTDLLMIWFGWFLRGKYDQRRTTNFTPATGALGRAAAATSLDGAGVTMYDSTLKAFAELLYRLKSPDASLSRDEKSGVTTLAREIHTARAAIATLRDRGVSEDLDAYPITISRQLAVSMRRVTQWILASSLSLTSDERVKARLLRDVLGVGLTPRTPLFPHDERTNNE